MNPFRCVITSYSIHYTKLYDEAEHARVAEKHVAMAACVLIENAEGGGDVVSQTQIGGPVEVDGVA